MSVSALRLDDMSSVLQKIGAGDALKEIERLQKNVMWGGPQSGCVVDL